MSEVVAALGRTGYEVPATRSKPASDAGSLDHLLAAERALGDPLIGVHAGARARPRDAVAHLILAAATLRESLRAIARFSRVLDGALDARLELDPTLARLVYRYDQSSDGHRHLVDYALMATTGVVRNAMGSSFRLDHVRLRHEPIDPAEYERSFRCPVWFRQPHDALVFDRADLDRAPRMANSDIAAPIERHLTVLADQMNATLRCRDRVAAIASEGFAAGMRIERAAVARRLHTSPPALVRRLAAEGTTFRAVREEVQWQAARTLLAEPEIKLESVALSLGFADGAAFAKAVRKRFGCSPTDHRRRILRRRGRGARLLDRT